MERAYRFRLYPTKIQEEKIVRNIGCCRYVFNHFLAQRTTQYKEKGKADSLSQQSRNLTILKQEYPWLQEADSTALQSALQDLDSAFQLFFRRVKNGEKPGYPRFKNKHDFKQSYRSKCVGTTIKVLDGAVRLPKIGNVKCRVSQEVKGRILSATVTHTPSGKYFVSLCCTDAENEKLPQTGRSVGIDMGIKTFAICSDGTKYANHKYLAKSEKKLAMLKRQLSRKAKGSARYEKTRKQAARLHEHIANQRKDAIHKISTKLIRENDVICIEDLAVQNMVKNHKMAKVISDAGWGEFKRQIAYKANWHGREMVKIDRFFPSSQICSECGAKWDGTKDLSVRKWKCPECGKIHDRDYNAAKNILTEGLRCLKAANGREGHART